MYIIGHTNKYSPAFGQVISSSLGSNCHEGIEPGHLVYLFSAQDSSRRIHQNKSVASIGSRSTRRRYCVDPSDFIRQRHRIVRRHPQGGVGFSSRIFL